MFKHTIESPTDGKLHIYRATSRVAYCGVRRAKGAKPEPAFLWDTDKPRLLERSGICPRCAALSLHDAVEQRRIADMN